MKKIFLILSIFILCSCERLNKQKEIQTYDELEVTNFEYEYGDLVKVTDIVINKNIIDDGYLPTDVLGENTYKIKYMIDDQVYFEDYKYNITDTQAPVVYLSGSYSVNVGYKKELDKAIVCLDNADSNPICEIIGDYDVNKVGKYPLKYHALDKSGNETNINFTLFVNKANSSSASSTKTYFSDVVKKYKDENTMIGIDVSKWQGTIDFKKVKDAGVEFVMIRLGYQNSFDSSEYTLDPYFLANIEGATSNNIPVGLYFYSYAINKEEGKKQAKYVIDTIKDYNIEMPIAFDWENFGSITGKGASIYDLRSASYAFQDTIKEAGYVPVHYGSKNYLNTFWLPTKYDTWLAHYTYNANKTNYDKDYIMWQLCNDGVVDGINGAVDIDVYYKK